SAAHDHSQEMINQDKQDHNLPGEDPLGTRFSKHGYAWDTNPFGGIGENIYAFSNSMLFAHAGFMVDWGFPGPGVVDGMQAPPGHRDNIMDADFREIGIGVIAENNAGTKVEPLVVTEDFGFLNKEKTNVYILGVAYKDSLVNDDFYSISADGKT